MGLTLNLDTGGGPVARFVIRDLLFVSFADDSGGVF